MVIPGNKKPTNLLSELSGRFSWEVLMKPCGGKRLTKGSGVLWFGIDVPICPPKRAISRVPEFACVPIFGFFFLTWKMVNPAFQISGVISADHPRDWEDHQPWIPSSSPLSPLTLAGLSALAHPSGTLVPLCAARFTGIFRWKSHFVWGFRLLQHWWDKHNSRFHSPPVLIFFPVFPHSFTTQTWDEGGKCRFRNTKTGTKRCFFGISKTRKPDTCEAVTLLYLHGFFSLHVFF